MQYQAYLPFDDNMLVHTETGPTKVNEDCDTINLLDLNQIFYHIGTVCNTPVRFKVFCLWFAKYRAINISGGDGIITAMSKESGFCTRTIRRALNAIHNDPVLGKLMIYKNHRKGNKKRDDGSQNNWQQKKAYD